MHPSPIITKKVADENRAAWDQYTVLFMSIMSDAIKPGCHGEFGLTVKVKDGKIMGAEEIRRRTHLVPRAEPSHVRRAA